MRRIHRALRIVLSTSLFAMAVLACGSNDDEELGSSGGSCTSDCRRRAAANCSTTPTNYTEDCIRACDGARERIKPECADELDAVFRCIAKTVQYECVNGVLAPTPQGACASEAALCASCSTGDLTACFGL